MATKRTTANEYISSFFFPSRNDFEGVSALAAAAPVEEE